MALDYWAQRVLADEQKAQRIAQNASEELKKMYRQQYLRKAANPLGLQVGL